MPTALFKLGDKVILDPKYGIDNPVIIHTVVKMFQSWGVVCYELEDSPTVFWEYELIGVNSDKLTPLEKAILGVE